MTLMKRGVYIALLKTLLFCARRFSLNLFMAGSGFLCTCGGHCALYGAVAFLRKIINDDVIIQRCATSRSQDQDLCGVGKCRVRAPCRKWMLLFFFSPDAIHKRAPMTNV